MPCALEIYSPELLTLVCVRAQNHVEFRDRNCDENPVYISSRFGTWRLTFSWHLLFFLPTSLSLKHQRMFIFDVDLIQSDAVVVLEVLEDRWVVVASYFFFKI